MPAVPHRISPPLRRELQQRYQHAISLMQQPAYDFDHAHSILVQCAVDDPGNSLYVEALLQNLQRKFNNNKRGSRLAIFGKRAFRKAVAKGDWAEVLKLGPHILRSNPWDVSTLRALAEACAAFGYNQVELRYLKNALEAKPKDAEVNKHCATSLARMGQFDHAIACWRQVDELQGGDAEAQRKIAELQSVRTDGRHGDDPTEPAPYTADAESTRQPGGPEQQFDRAMEPSSRNKATITSRQQLEQAIASDPTDIDSYLELAQLHISEERLGEATDVLTHALAASGNQIKIQEQLEEVQLLRKRQQLATAERKLQAEGTAASQELVHSLHDDLNRMELEVLDRRSQRYPTDLELKFQLALRLKRSGNPREAISQFEQARQLPERRTYAALEMGECLQRLRQFEKALEQYRIAAEESSMPGIELKKLALYRIGVLAEALRRIEEAEHSLNSLVALDPEFRDAATRLDKIRTMRHKQP